MAGELSAPTRDCLSSTSSTNWTSAKRKKPPARTKNTTEHALGPSRGWQEGRGCVRKGGFGLNPRSGGKADFVVNIILLIRRDVKRNLCLFLMFCALPPAHAEESEVFVRRRRVRLARGVRQPVALRRVCFGWV